MPSEAPLWLRVSGQHGKAQEGMALLLTLILLAVLSAMAISLMFLSQSETWSSMNYRLMNQARDGAEAGINVAANFIVNTANDPNKYTPPATAGTDPITAYVVTVSPVTAGGTPVVLSSDITAWPPNYPYATAQTNFNTTGQGNLTAGTATVNYTTSAALLAMRQVNPYGGTCPDLTPGPCTIQTWRVTSDGNIPGVRNAEVEVEAVLEKPIAPAFDYAAFGTDPNCGSLNWRGTNSTTGSYDSTNLAAGTAAYGGNVGSNGNLTEAGGAEINGSLSTPRSGEGNCSGGNITACTPEPCNVDAGINELPQAINFPPPALPTPTPPTSNDGISNDGQCSALSGCSIITSGTDYRLDPTCAATTGLCPAGSTPLYGNLSLQSGKIFHICTGTYIMNSISLTGNASLVVDAGCGPIVINVAGAGIGANQQVVSFSGGIVANPTMNPLNLQIQYAGTSDMTLSGGNTTALTVYAPLSDITLTGGSAIYGSIIGSTVTNSGGTNLYYDRSLQNGPQIIGNYMMSSFTWKKF